MLIDQMMREQVVTAQTEDCNDFFLTTSWITKTSDSTRSVMAKDDSIRRDQDNFLTSLSYGALKEDWMCRNYPEKLSKRMENFKEEMRYGSRK